MIVNSKIFCVAVCGADGQRIFTNRHKLLHLSSLDPALQLLLLGGIETVPSISTMSSNERRIFSTCPCRTTRETVRLSLCVFDFHGLTNTSCARLCCGSCDYPARSIRFFTALQWKQWLIFYRRYFLVELAMLMVKRGFFHQKISCLGDLPSPSRAWVARETDTRPKPSRTIDKENLERPSIDNNKSCCRLSCRPTWTGREYSSFI